MFTYLRQPRRVRILGPLSPTFPSDACLTFRLAPPQLFGAEPGPIRAIRLGSDYHVVWDANTDRTHGYPDPGFSRLRLSVESMGGRFEVDGNEVSFHIRVQSEAELLEHLQVLQFALPPALSTVLPDPVHVTHVGGVVGEAAFRVEHLESRNPLLVLDDARLAERVSKAIGNIAAFKQHSGFRLLAATRYVHNAARLLAAGYSPWEFMGEALLNYSKALEVLFGDSRDAQRAGLRAVGVVNADLEARLIPVTLLRDFLDVAHPRLSQLDGPRLKRLYLFLLGLEQDFQDVLAKARDAIVAGEWTPTPATAAALDPADLRTLDRVLDADETYRQAKWRQADA